MTPRPTRSGRALVGRGLAEPDPGLQAVAVAVALEEGVDRYAEELTRSAAGGGLAAEALTRSGALDEVDDGDPWVDSLRRWAAVAAPAAHSPTGQDDPSAPAGRRRGAAATAVDVVAITAAVLTMGRAGHAFDGFPKGSDAWGHVSKVRLLLDSFPHVNWNYAWYGGLPYFHGSYPPLYHVLVAAATWLTGAGIPSVMVAVAAASLVVTCLALYGVARMASGQRVAGLAAAVLVLAAPSVWSSILSQGLYPRLLGLAFLSTAVLAATADARRPSRGRWLAVVAALAAALSTHLFMGLLAALLVALVHACTAEGRQSRRWVRTAAALVAAGGVCAYFYVPFVLAPKGQPPLWSHDRPVPLGALIRPGPRETDSLPTVLLPALGAAVATVAVSRLRPRSRLRPALRRRLGGRPAGPAGPAGGGPAPPAAGGTDGDHGDDLAAALAAGYGPATTAGLRLRRWRRRRSATRLPGRVAAALGGVAAAALVYCLAGHVVRFPFYINGVSPRDMLVVPSVLLAVAAAVLFGGLLSAVEAPRRRAAAAAAGLAVGLAGAGLTLPLLARAARPVDEVSKRRLMGLLPLHAVDRRFRVAALTDETSDWINGRSPVPQVRGYQAQAVTRPDWQYWLETTLSDPGVSPAERRFVLDWNAVRWLYAGPADAQVDSYRRDPDFEPLATRRYYYQTFTFRHPSPVLGARAGVAALVVGRGPDYDALFRALAPSDADSRRLVPVRGAPFVDDYSAAELRRFDTVVLYGAG
ncbi:MAG: hypothetical protein LC792_17990, partial [Actinobacteria bacterium]|nr:hypothetical protein [Actinomycetota bacterium]